MFRYYLKSFIELGVYENFLMLCVFLNTLILSLDGLVDAE